MKRAAFALISLAALCANAEPDAATRFGARQNVQDIALSPDGSRLVYAIAGTGQGSRLLTVQVGSQQPQAVTSVDGVAQRLGGCNWVSTARLVCSLFVVTKLSGGELLPISRLVALDADGRNARQLGQRGSPDQLAARLWGGSVIDWLPGRDNMILMAQLFVPEAKIGTLVQRTGDGLGVVVVDSASGRTRTVEPPRANATRYISDGEGLVLMLTVSPQRGASGQASKS